MSEGNRPAKIEMPLASDAEIAELVREFEACRWPHRHWTHRAHLAVALWYLQHHSPRETLELLRCHIPRYNRSIPGGDPNGYHETITVFFVHRLTSLRRRLQDRFALAEMLPLLLPSCSVACLGKYYSPERLWSAEARESWLEPDLYALDDEGAFRVHTPS